MIKSLGKMSCLKKIKSRLGSEMQPFPWKNKLFESSYLSYYFSSLIKSLPILKYCSLFIQL